MSLEVANLKATIEFAAKGEAQAKQAAESVQKAVDSLGNSIDVVTGKTQRNEMSVNAAMQTLARMGQSYDAATSGVEAYSSAVERNASSVNTASDNVIGLTRMVSQLTTQMDSLSGTESEAAKKALEYASSGLKAAESQKKEAKTALELAKALKILEDRRDSLLSRRKLTTAEFRETLALDKVIPGGVQSLVASEKRVVIAARRTDREIVLATRGIKKLQDIAGRAAGARGGGRGGLSALVRNFGGIASASRGGVTGISMMATSLGRLGPIAIAAAAALALVWKSVKALKEIEAVSHIAPLSDTIVKLGANSLRTENQLKPLVQQLRNFVSGEGFANVDSIVDSIFSMGAALQNMTPSGTLEESLRLVQTLLAGGTKAAKDLGLSAPAAYDAMLRSLEPLATEQDKFRAIMNMMSGDIMANSQARTAADMRNQDSLEQLSYAWREMMAVITDLVAGPLASFLIWIANSIRGLTILVEKAVALGDAFFGWMPDVMSQFDEWIDKMGAAGKVLNFLAKGPLWGTIDLLADVGREAKDAARNLEDMAEPDFSTTITQLEAIQQAQKNFKLYLDTVRQAQSAVGAVKSLGDAINDLEKTPSPQNVMALMNAFQSMFAIVQAGGLESLDAMESFGKSLGMGPEVDAIISDFIRLSRDAMEPILEDMNAIGVEAEKVKGPMDTAAGSFFNAGNVAAIAAGQVNSLASSLGSVAGDYTVRLNVITSGSLTTTGTTIPGRGTQDQGGVAVRGVRSVRDALGSLEPPAPSVADGISPGRRRFFEGLNRRAQKLQERQDSQNNQDSLLGRVTGGATALADMFRKGGGGGGGAAQDRNATIEEIRAFIEQVNKAVMAGIRGGVVFSTAGNAIPLGGPGEFIRNEGGVNIGVINLRGVWDFADPAAKREIVRQLQEALVQYQKEIA